MSNDSFICRLAVAKLFNWHLIIISTRHRMTNGVYTLSIWHTKSFFKLVYRFTEEGRAHDILCGRNYP